MEELVLYWVFPATLYLHLYFYSTTLALVTLQITFCIGASVVQFEINLFHQQTDKSNIDSDNQKNVEHQIWCRHVTHSTEIHVTVLVALILKVHLISDTLRCNMISWLWLGVTVVYFLQHWLYFSGSWSYFLLFRLKFDIKNRKRWFDYSTKMF